MTPSAGRAASRIATSENPIAAASVSMWPASESSASEPASEAGDDLEQHEAEDQREGDGELAAVGVGRDAVRVALVTPVRVGVHPLIVGTPAGRVRAQSARVPRSGEFPHKREWEDPCTIPQGVARWTIFVQCGTTAILNRNLPRLADELRGELEHTGYVREPTVVSNLLTRRLTLTARIEAGTPQTAITVAETALLAHLRGHGARVPHGRHPARRCTGGAV